MMSLEQRTLKIDEQIKAAMAEEPGSGYLAQFLSNALVELGQSAAPEDVAGVVRFVEGYIKQVPYLMSEGLKSAQAVELGPPMEHLLTQAAGYWDEPNDLIPDALGLVGLMDDAYFSLSLIQVLSDYCEMHNGVPLLVYPLTQSNRVVRGFIGDAIGAELDKLVLEAFGLAQKSDAASKLTTYEGATPIFPMEPTYVQPDADLRDEIKIMLTGTSLYLPD
jgi:hypothetical protein